MVDEEVICINDNMFEPNRRVDMWRSGKADPLP